MVIQMQVFLLVYLCLFILFHESIQMSFGSGLMRKINAKSDVETVFVSQRDGKRLPNSSMFRSLSMPMSLQLLGLKAW